MQAPATRPSDRAAPIVLVGASVRSAAESACRAGFRVVAVDQFGDRETRAAATEWFSLDSVRLSRRIESDLITPSVRLAIVGGLCGDYEVWPDARLKHYGTPPSVFKDCDGPVFLRTLAEDAGVAFPETRDSLPPTPAGWLIKRRSSCGGLGVLPTSSQTRVTGNDANLYFQRRERGRVVGASFLASGTQSLLLGVCGQLTKRIGDRHFVYAGSVGPLDLSESVRQQIVQLGTAFVRHNPISGPFNIDVIVNRDRVTLLEVNPRWSASMELLEQSWMHALDQACSFFEPFEVWQTRVRVNRCHHVFWKRILYARRDQLVTPDQFQDCSAGWTWMDTPSQPTKVQKGEPIATMRSRVEGCDGVSRPCFDEHV